MRFMMLLKATAQTEAGLPPSTEIIEAMGAYNAELVKAGVMLAGEGLQASSKGARVRFSAGKHTVTDGPFAETKELIAGFWMIAVSSKAEAIEWASRCPHPFGAGDFEIELRQVYEAADFGPEFTSAQREAEERLREQVDANR